MFLLDTMVLSELRRVRRNPRVVTWVKSVPERDLFLSVVTIAEIELGIERQRRPNPIFADELATWLDVVLRAYSERILPLTVGVARRWGRLAAGIRDKEMDMAIAAIALEHGLTVVTRNVADFAPTGVAVLNPFDARAAG